MEMLTHKHLTTMTLAVDFRNIVRIGMTPAGIRSIAPVTSGRFEGERLSGTVLGGHDWVLMRPDGVMLIDVRLTLKANDGALIYMTYQGKFTASPADMERFSKGHLLDSRDYSLTITAKLECGDERYTWLNDAVYFGVGEQTTSGPIYKLFEVG